MWLRMPDPSYEPRKAMKDDKLNTDIESQFDIGIAKREKQTWVYLVIGDQDQIEQVVLPIYGMGLWSTLYGYVAVDNDIRTISGLTYYEHAETPGLGGEVENPNWKSKWVGKHIWLEGGPAERRKLDGGRGQGSSHCREGTLHGRRLVGGHHYQSRCRFDAQVLVQR